MMKQGWSSPISLSPMRTTSLKRGLERFDDIVDILLHHFAKQRQLNNPAEHAFGHLKVFGIGRMMLLIVRVPVNGNVMYIHTDISLSHLLENCVAANAFRHQYRKQMPCRPPVLLL